MSAKGEISIACSSNMVKLTYLMEKSDHDGYCSGNETEYTQSSRTCFAELPAKYAQAEVGDIITNYTWDDIISSFDEDEHSINLSGSWYCTNDPRAVMYNITAHDVRYTVLSAIVVQPQSMIKSAGKR